jgi:tetratricopeptide (TPR) repeat protein
MKRWLFRGLAIVLVPGICLAAAEGLLRLVGYGHATSFLLARDLGESGVLISNPRFGWRFFGRQPARQPASVQLARHKPAGDVRIFVFGESAAYGDPLPEFGLPRLLESLLGLRFPGVRFGVVNAAMTGINSHAVLPIARDCASAGGDIWVIYMGNNEVVGPFGPGTVFGRRGAPLAWIRANLAMKSTRLGQAIAELSAGVNPSPESPSEWEGMRMFVAHQVRQDDPRLAAVYRHFTGNLEDILDAGLRRGMGLVVSTVAVNLRDCAPFASGHRPNIPEGQKQQWDAWCRQAGEAEADQRWPEANRCFEEAARIDDTSAELQFRWARTLLALGQAGEAKRRFVLARDLDTLRFRCDSPLNAIVRDVAARHVARGVRLADAEAAFAEQSPDGIAGNDHFLEHVHLNFEGNYLLALTLGRQVEPLLPAEARRGVAESQPWPAPEACARRLAWADWNRQHMATEVLSRLYDPPFSTQLNHGEELRRWARELGRLQPGLSPAALREAEAQCRAAVAAVPWDPVLPVLLAQVRQRLGDLPGAQSAIQHSVDLRPFSSAGWQQLGSIQMQRQQYAEAIDSWTKALGADPDSYWAREKLGQCLAALGRHKEALRAYQAALALKPRFGPAHLGLGKTLEALGRNTEAENHYRLALQNRVLLKAELLELAHFCRSRGWHAQALTNYLDVLRRNPADATVHLYVGQTLEALHRGPEAQRHYAEATERDPGLAPARFLLGLQAGRQGNAEEAAAQFQAVVQLMPDLVEARLNLGVALTKLGRSREAKAQFDEVLRRDPTNAVALRELKTINAGANPDR